ncbi:PH domain-containing protein [Puerhibacterium puerhi]|uniref:PH domain-containing protein n=1 Tax=Puerhibacterium puerhi TaxID=2692623 RepID=UPI0013568C6A|nr:PH domain-containing protein [Puerhibacterium puerhi]
MTHDARYRTFRPRWGQVAAWAVGVISVGGTVLVAFTSRGPLGQAAGNRLSFALFALCAALLLWRVGGVHARPSPQGLVVRNIVRTRRLEWAEILAVRFGVNDPWVRLDLADGDTIALIGIQRADGEHAMAEARRLVALVQEHGEASEPGERQP